MAKTKSQRKELTTQSHQELKQSQTTNQRKGKKMSKVVSLKSKEQEALLKVIYSVLDTLPHLDKTNKDFYANYEDFLLHLTKDEYRSFWDAYQKLL